MFDSSRTEYQQVRDGRMSPCVLERLELIHVYPDGIGFFRFKSNVEHTSAIILQVFRVSAEHGEGILLHSTPRPAMARDLHIFAERHGDFA